MGILHLSSHELRSKRFQETRTIILPHPSTKKRNTPLKIIKNQITTNKIIKEQVASNAKEQMVILPTLKQNRM
jgi:hypothetical protein